MTLTIRNVTCDAHGVYVVRARNAFGEVASEANLTVTPKPKKTENSSPVFKVGLADRAVAEHEPVRFECVVIGVPRPAVSSPAGFL